MELPVSEAGRKFRKLLQGNGLILAPIVFDPLTARIAEMVGLGAVSLGGYAVGAHLCVTEPLTTLTEMVAISRNVASAVEIPVIVDAGAGYGEPLHVVRTVKEFEKAQIAGIHIEDQVYPKRMHYHRDYEEHTIGEQEMVDKIHFACQARSSNDFIIMARTDTARTHGAEEAIRRGNAYADAGADMVMVFPNNLEDTRIMPKKIKVPLAYVNSPGNRVGRPVLTVKELEEMGYRMLSDSTSVILSGYQSMKKALSDLVQKGTPPLQEDTAMKLRLELENDCLRFPSFYSIERRTTEKKQ